MKDFPSIPGVELYLSGGSVRDFIMGRDPHDRDFVMLTELSLEEVEDRLLACGHVIYQTKPEFQIILCRIDGENIDLAFPREESSYSDKRRPDNTTRTTGLLSDSSRRDFTINSMYMDRNYNIIDYRGGREDIKEKVIRCVGDPDERFKEDPLRILRAIRFSVTLGFSIEKSTMNAMLWNKMLLAHPSVSVDRIKTEINRAMDVDPTKTLNYVNVFDLISTFIIKDENLRFELVNRH